MTDAIATREGYTKEVIADAGEVTLCLLIQPDTDLDSRFKAHGQWLVVQL